MTQTTLINLHPSEHIEELGYYSFAVKLNRCIWSRNTLNDISNKVMSYGLFKTEDLI